MKEEYHQIPLSALPATLAHTTVMDYEEGIVLPEVARLGFFAKIVLYHPSGVGSNAMDAFARQASQIKDLAPVAAKLLAETPLKDKHCFERMYGHIAETLVRAKLKVAFVCPKDSPLAKDAPEGVEVYRCNTQADVMSTALALIKKDSYQLIAVHQTYYEAAVQLSRPFGRRASDAMDEHARAFALLSSALEVYSSSDAMIGWCPTHGTDKGLFGVGSVRHSPACCNVTHYFGTVETLHR